MIFIDLYTIDDLSKLEHDYNEDIHFTIAEGNIATIKNVKIIKGFLSISNSNFLDFGDIEEIMGSLDVSSNCKKLKSLGKIAKIDGDLYLRFSSIETLSKLKFVKGNINIKDTNLSDIGDLEFVDGYLYLSKSMNSKLNLENVKVTKQIKYYSEYKNPSYDSGLLIKSEKPVVNWEPGYIYFYDEISKANTAQKEYYEYFRNNFFNKEYIDIENIHSYAFVLMFELLDELKKSNDLNYENLLLELAKHYLITSSYVYDNLVFYYDSIGNYEKGFEYYLKHDFISLFALCRYSDSLKRNVFNPDTIIRITGSSFLTEFGQKNVENIKPFVMELFNEFEQKYSCPFLCVFIDYPHYYKKFSLVYDENPSTLKGYNPSYYKPFFSSEDEYEYWLNEDRIRSFNNFDWNMTKVVERAIINQLREFVHKSEDNYRSSVGLPKIGEGWISETELFYKILNSFDYLEVLQHGRPKWLGMQHLDIYIPELNLAFEYQGIQHEKPVDFFGGINGLMATQRRDEFKRNKCREQGLTLIYVYPDYSFEGIKQTIKRRMLFKEKTANNHLMDNSGY